MFDECVFEFELLREYSNGVKHVFAFTLELLLQVPDFNGGSLVLSSEFFEFFVFDVDFFL